MLVLACGMPIPRETSEQPIRYELAPVPPLVEYGLLRSKVKPTPPALILDLGINDTVRVIDANTKALITSNSIAAVTATPAKWKRASDENNSGYTQPLLIVDVPGLQPLRIGARVTRSAWGSPNFRYGWSGWVSDAEQPGYKVTEEEWYTLAEKFGLGALVVDDAASGKMQQRNRRGMLKFFGTLAAILLAFAVAAYLRITGRG
jgi:hypothetical protein